MNISDASISRKLVEHGINVVGLGRNVDRLKQFQEALSGPGTFCYVQCDVSNEEDVLSAFKLIDEKFGKLHICINNAGLSHAAPILTGSVVEWKEILETNILGPTICTREALKSMQKNGIDNGMIININSMSGHRIVDNKFGHMYIMGGQNQVHGPWSV